MGIYSGRAFTSLHKDGSCAAIITDTTHGVPIKDISIASKSDFRLHQQD